MIKDIPVDSMLHQKTIGIKDPILNRHSIFENYCKCGLSIKVHLDSMKPT